MESPQPDELTEAELRALLAAEQANAAHWRWVAERRVSADETLVKRPLVRLALAVDRRARKAAHLVRTRVTDRAGRAPDADAGSAERRPTWDGSGTARIIITIVAPTREVAEQWGDVHLARGLADALGRRGHDVDIQALDGAAGTDPDRFDLEIVIRGLATVPKRSARRQVLWIISHPEAVTATECADADLVLTGSELHALKLRRDTATPVGVMLQATDPDHFRPEARRESSAHDVVVVAKTRGVFRPMVRHAVDAGLRPAVYGSGWHSFIDPTLIESERVPHDELPSVYASAGVVLNDHWDTMAAWGFVSNRIFDALSCGTPVISDPVPGIDDLFDGAVRTASDASELAAAVHEILDDPEMAAAASLAARRSVVEHHTFDHRAEQLLTALALRGQDHHAS